MEQVDALLAEFVESLALTPAAVVDARWDVVASNALARAVSPSLAVGTNLAEATLLGGSARRTLREWDVVATRMADLLARPLSRDDDTTPLHGLTVAMEHPEVGRLDLTYELLRVTGAEQTVILGHAAVASESERRLLTLAARLGPAAR
ncbi:MmyB family transcriptional regulator [Demequina soli]|uniref:MmyB family transcriptional regulator n=1 Tax=Demequina soli TaxID=1638987 RepID=UPI0007824EE8|nr:hypothetical protein [Demequina soli]